MDKPSLLSFALKGDILPHIQSREICRRTTERIDGELEMNGVNARWQIGDVRPVLQEISARRVRRITKPAERR